MVQGPCLGFRFQGRGLRVKALGSRFRVQGLGLEFKVHGSGFRVQVRVKGSRSKNGSRNWIQNSCSKGGSHP